MVPLSLIVMVGTPPPPRNICYSSALAISGSPSAKWCYCQSCGPGGRSSSILKPYLYTYRSKLLKQAHFFSFWNFGTWSVLFLRNLIKPFRKPGFGPDPAHSAHEPDPTEYLGPTKNIRTQTKLPDRTRNPGI